MAEASKALEAPKGTTCMGQQSFLPEFVRILRQSSSASRSAGYNSSISVLVLDENGLYFRPFLQRLSTQRISGPAAWSLSICLGRQRGGVSR